MLTRDVKEGIVALERCIAIDNVCHGREGNKSKFFYKYSCKCLDAHVRLTFDELTLGVLRTLNCSSNSITPKLIHLIASLLANNQDVRVKSCPPSVFTLL